MHIRLALTIATAALALATVSTAGVSAQTTMAPAAPGTLALDTRALRAQRTSTGYTLTGQAQVNNACQAARFDRSLGNMFPPQFDLTQFRRPGTQNLMCGPRLTWVTITPQIVTSAAPPRYVIVRTKQGMARVPVL